MTRNLSSPPPPGDTASRQQVHEGPVTGRGRLDQARKCVAPGLGELFAGATFTLDETTARGREEIEQRARGIIQVNEDGTSQTRHNIANLIIEVDEEAGTATARAYWTVLQSVRGLPQQPVLAGRNQNRFERDDGKWRFTELKATTTWSAG